MGDSRNRLWASPATSMTDLIGVGATFEASDIPICCWNICPSQGAELDAGPPRTPGSGMLGGGTLGSGFAPPGAILADGTPPAGGDVAAGDTAGWVSRRLLVESAGSDRHLIFNPLTGAVDRVDGAGLQRLKDAQAGRAVAWAPDEEQDLRARGYLFDDAGQEERFLERSVEVAWGRMQARQPAMYTVCPTLACNLACAYCFEGDSLTEKKQGVMTEAQVDAVFAAIAELRQGAVEPEAAPWIGLFGGEPLLPSTRRCVEQILVRAAAGGFLVGAITNGVNLVRFEDLLREYAALFTVFQVTLDGPKEVHDRRRHRLGGQGTFDEIVRGIDLLLDLGIDVDLRVNVDADNLAALPELVDFLDGRGWADRPGFRLALAPVTAHSPGGDGASAGCGSGQGRVLSEMEMALGVMALMDDHPRMAELCHLGFLRHLDYLVSVLEPGKHRGLRGGRPGPRYWYCEASSDKQYVFTPEGLIYSCTEAVGKPRHAVGRFDPSLDLWGRESRAWVGRTILSHPKCRACSISTLCGGGCNFAARERAGAGERAGSGDDLLQIAVGVRGPRFGPAGGPPEPFCNAAEETVRAYLRHAGARITA